MLLFPFRHYLMHSFTLHIHSQNLAKCYIILISQALPAEDSGRKYSSDCQHLGSHEGSRSAPKITKGWRGTERDDEQRRLG